MLQPGQGIIPFTLSLLDSAPWQLSSLCGKPDFLAFFRFASRVICNLPLHQLIKRFDELPADSTIVAVSKSSVTELQRYAKRHDSTFPILADEDGGVHCQNGASPQYSNHFNRSSSTCMTSCKIITVSSCKAPPI